MPRDPLIGLVGKVSLPRPSRRTPTNLVRGIAIEWEIDNIEQSHRCYIQSRYVLLQPVSLRVETDISL